MYQMRMFAGDVIPRVLGVTVGRKSLLYLTIIPHLNIYHNQFFFKMATLDYRIYLL